jgi:hypothetical protein
MDNWSNAFGFDNCPDKENKTGGGNNVRLDGEEMSNLVDREPDSRQTAQPKDEEADEVAGVCARACWHAIGKIILPFVNLVLSSGVIATYKFAPNGPNHEIYAGSSDPSLNTVPNAGHCSSIEDGPQGSPNTKGRTGNDWKTKVISCTDTTGCTDKTRGNRVADPDTKPRLPPGKTSASDVGGRNHPGVDVETVG